MGNRRQFLWGSAAAGGAVLAGCATLPKPGAETPVRPMLEQAVGARPGAGMVAVVVDDRGSSLIAHGASGVPGVALDGDTVFEIMSITKVLTSLVLSDMVGRGEVAFDDPVAAYLPPAAAPGVRGRPITLLDLATYTSGLPNMPGNLPPDWYARPDPLGEYSERQLDAFLSGYTPEYAPGVRYRYANLGFGLLGNALARRAGKSYETLLVERVCDPLGLDHTRITLTPQMQRHLAQGHDLNGRPTPLWNFPAMPGAGTVRTNANDLTAFLKACMGLSKTPLDAALARLRAIRRPTNLSGTQAGLGWYITSDAGDEIAWKTGLSGGCNTFVGFSPRRRRGAVLLSNFLWRPLDTGTINLGMKLIDPDAPARDYGPLNSSD